jgi:hypothetical protein
LNIDNYCFEKHITISKKIGEYIGVIYVFAVLLGGFIDDEIVSEFEV